MYIYICIYIHTYIYAYMFVFTSLSLTVNGSARCTPASNAVSVLFSKSRLTANCWWNSDRYADTKVRAKGASRDERTT